MTSPCGMFHEERGPLDDITSQYRSAAHNKPGLSRIVSFTKRRATRRRRRLAPHMAAIVGGRK